MKYRFVLTIACCGLFLLSGSSFLLHAAKPSKELRQEIRASKPGKFHKMLTPLVGKWQVGITIKSASTGTVEHLKGTARSQWILDRRFVQQHFKTKSAGRRVEGYILIGYDNIRKEYVGAFLSNISSGLVPFSGEVSPDGSSFVFDMGASTRADGSRVHVSASIKVLDKTGFEFVLEELDESTSRLRLELTVHYSRR